MRPCVTIRLPSDHEKKEYWHRQVTILVYICVLLETILFAGQEQTSPDWHSYDLPFRVLNITSTGQLLWICGTDETIAVSSDNGLTGK